MNLLRAEAQPEMPAASESSDRELLGRFVRNRDEASFRALVERHGPMVLAVCRRVLGDRHAAEDVFQATFQVLAQKAAGLAEPELLGKWLYGVAYRLAAKARVAAARRRTHERQAATMVLGDPELESAWREIHQILDEELNQLPAKFRNPLVLCYLQGMTNEQAAALLGCPLGSMSWRLTQARERLRQRLERRGLALTAGLLLLLLALESGADVSASLVKKTVKAGVASAGELATAPSGGVKARTPFVQLIVAGLLVALLLGSGALACSSLGARWWSDTTPRCKAKAHTGDTRPSPKHQIAQP